MNKHLDFLTKLCSTHLAVFTFKSSGGGKARQRRKQERLFQVSCCRRPKEPASVPVEVLGVVEKKHCRGCCFTWFCNNVEAEL